MLKKSDPARGLADQKDSGLSRRDFTHTVKCLFYFILFYFVFILFSIPRHSLLQFSTTRPWQELITWSIPLPCVHATAFSQVGLFLDL